jgi:hypothetical protein
MGSVELALTKILDPTIACGDPRTVVRVGSTQIEITEKLKAEMGKHKFEQLAELMRHTHALDTIDPQKILDEIMGADPNVIAKMPRIPVSAQQGAAQQGATRNYEAAIYSRLAVIEGTHHSFDMIKVHRTRDGDKFYVFVVTNDKWVVLEDDELFPSDKLISALRCLTL